MTAIAPNSSTYEPRGGALDLFGSRAPEIAYHGPAGTGKSRADLEKLHLICDFYKGARCLVVRKTRVSMTESTLVTFEKKVMDPRSVIPSGARREFRHSYEFYNGSSIVLGGMDNPDRIMSTEYDVILYVEATEGTEDECEKLSTRLRNGVVPYQQIILECNPAHPQHWIKKRIDRGQAKEIISRHEDNPSITPEYLETLSRMTGHRRARLFLGQWAAAEGLVYENFDRDIHIIDAMPEGWEKWRKVRGIDFGYTNFFVCQWWAVDGDGRMYLYREYVRAGVTVKNHAEVIKRLSGDEVYDFTVADHDAEDRATLRECGIETVPANKDVSPGIQAVTDRLRVQGDGKPRMYFLRSALVESPQSAKPVGMVAEIEGYMWHPPKEGRSDKEEPIKENDHSCDTTRYVTMHVDQPYVPLVYVIPEDEQQRPDVWSDTEDWQ